MKLETKPRKRPCHSFLHLLTHSCTLHPVSFLQTQSSVKVEKAWWWEMQSAVSVPRFCWISKVTLDISVACVWGDSCTFPHTHALEALCVSLCSWAEIVYLRVREQCEAKQAHAKDQSPALFAVPHFLNSQQSVLSPLTLVLQCVLIKVLSREYHWYPRIMHHCRL